MKRKIIAWFSIGAVVIAGVLSVPVREASADIWGGDVAVLVNILAQAIKQLTALQSIIGTTRQTVSILEEMNRGVKEVLRLAQTAHVPLPKQVYEQASQIDQALDTARRMYGSLSGSAPPFQRAHYQSGIEGLFLSQDAFDYSTFLDKTGEKVKTSAVVASQASATRLTAETLGVVIHAISQSNRIQAKSLEISSTDRLEHTARANASFQTFLDSHNVIENDLRSSGVSPLNSFAAPASTNGSENGRIP